MEPQAPCIPAVNTGVYATLRDVVTKLLGNSLPLTSTYHLQFRSWLGKSGMLL